MPQTAPKTVICPACGDRVRVPVGGPGRPVTCDCGESFRVPAQPSAALAERVASYGSRRRRTVQQDEDPLSSPARQFYFPLFMLIAGLAMWWGQALFRPLGKSIGAGLVMSFVLLFLTVAVMLIGMMLCAKMMGTNFGSLGSVIFKLAATAVFASAAFALIASLDMHSPRGPLTGWHAAILIYAVAFKTMFDLDWQEALMTVGIIALLQALTFLVIFQGLAT